MEKRRIAGLTIVTGLALAALFFFLLSNAAENPEDTTDLPRGIVEIADTEIYVDVAYTPQSRQRGLSGRSGLSADEGMLFVYPQEGIYGFWMPDMNFSIDILWIDMHSRSSGTIVSIKENATPESYPEVFYPDSGVSAVLEVSAGFVQQYGVKVGESVSFKEVSVEPL